MFHKQRNVKVLKDFELQLEFQEGGRKLHEVKPLETIPAFSIFKDKPYLLEDAEVDTDGYDTVWNAEAELSCNELWDNGRYI